MYIWSKPITVTTTVEDTNLSEIRNTELIQQIINARFKEYQGRSINQRTLYEIKQTMTQLFNELESLIVKPDIEVLIDEKDLNKIVVNLFEPGSKEFYNINNLWKYQ